MALPDEAVAPLTHRYQQALIGLDDRAERVVSAAWLALGSYDRADIVRFDAAVAIIAAATKQTAAQVAAGYLALLTGRQVAVDVAALPVVLDTAGPFHATWNALSEGRDYAEAVEVGHSQATAEVRNLTRSTAYQASDQFIDRSDLTARGWRRTPNQGACAWCLQVAGQTYSSAGSADFGHDRCKCTAFPLTDS